MFNIQTRNTIASVGLDLFEKGKYHVAEDVPHPDAILLRSCQLTKEDIKNSVKAVARAGAGVNNIPVEMCTERGIVVFNTPGANANSVKELVIAGLLLSSRGIYEGMNWVKAQSNTPDFGKKIEENKSNFSGNEINGKTLGIVGLGAIGVLVANAAVELGMQVYGYDPFISINAAWGLSSRVRRCESLDQILVCSDYITLHIPLTDNTENLINSAALKRAKPSLRLLNFARSGLVERAAVKSALKNGKLHRYVTDFPTPELINVAGVISIPHIGASTEEAEDNCAMMAVRQLQDFFQNGNIVNSVNFPSCSLDTLGGTRLLIANKNIPNMLSRILEIIAGEGLNIEEMVNKHHHSIAYNIIALSAHSIHNSIVNKISAIEGVFMVRQIIPARS